MRPPNHRISTMLQMVDRDDPAWDFDRIAAETSQLGEELLEHPIVRYRSGETHFDLDAPGTVYDDGPREATPREYLKSTPRFFLARRLSLGELTTCLDRGDHTGSSWAFSLGVKRIDGFAFDLINSKAMSDSQVQQVVDTLGADAALRIGAMILKASRAPNPAEGKPFGSSRGPRSHGQGVSPAAGDRGTATATAEVPTASGLTPSGLEELARG